jgi:hypothetical protein
LIRTLSPRYDHEPVADDLIVLKNDVFGAELYAPAAKWDFSPRYALEPDAEDPLVIKNDVFGVELYAPLCGFISYAR